MKIFVFAPLAVLGHHFETDLEIVQNLLDQGHEVTMVNCSSELRKLNFMSCQGFLRCQFCKSRCSEGIGLLTNTSKLKLRNIGEFGPIQCVGDLNLTDFQKVKDFEYNKNDIGSAYISSLISELRNPLPPMASLQIQTREILEFLAGYTQRIEQLLDEEHPDCVYLFNGRFTLYRPLVRICQQRKLPFYVHERGATNELYLLTYNNLPHDPATREHEIHQIWADAKIDVDARTKIGADWYVARAGGQGQSWHSFTDQQDASRLPAGWSPQFHNVAVYVTSEDEFASIPGWEIEIFQSQIESLRFIFKHFENDPSIRFYLRMHPNMRGLKNADIAGIANLGSEFRNVVIISPDSEVSTYTLMQKANKVLSFGSTTGTEAAFFGVPSILIGKAFYMNLGSVYHAKSRQQVLDLVGNKELKPLSKDGAILYGYWAASIGEPFKHYKATSLTTGRFNGHVILGHRLLMLINYFFVLLDDLRKILKGEYGVWHLMGKIKAKAKLLKA